MGNYSTVIEENAFLYSLSSGSLKIHEGRVVKPPGFGRSGTLVSATKKNMVAGLEPNVVYSGVVWLTERNDDLAIEILIAHEENEILKLDEQILNRRHKIHILKASNIDS